MAGLVDAGEQVRLIREPNNRYDRQVMSYGLSNRPVRLMFDVLEMPLRCRILAVPKLVTYLGRQQPNLLRLSMPA